MTSREQNPICAGSQLGSLTSWETRSHPRAWDPNSWLSKIIHDHTSWIWDLQIIKTTSADSRDGKYLGYNSKCDNSIDTTSYQAVWLCVCQTGCVSVWIHLHTNVSVGMCVFSSSSLIHNKLPQTVAWNNTHHFFTHSVLGLTELSWVILTWGGSTAAVSLWVELKSSQRPLHTHVWGLDWENPKNLGARAGR